mmetsp:Transcript_83898/g.264879  ORF Transcript_83898/g.264879 Transcript_83898/m.264879 type:complete len:259 (-) Transcript_83898:16-792(-)
MLGQYPLPMLPGWSSTTTCARKCSASAAGSLVRKDATMPRRRSRAFTALPRATPTTSPPLASLTRSPSLWMDRTSPICPPGEKITLMPVRSEPVSTRPTTTVPASSFSCTLSTGSLNGFSAGLLMGPISSRTSIADLPAYQPALDTRLSPCRPEIGTKGTSFCLYPTSFRKAVTTFLTSSNLAAGSSKDASSILLTQTATLFMPMVKLESASSRARPLSTAASNSLVAGTTRTATSVMEVTLSRFLAKSALPGVSIAV